MAVDTDLKLALPLELAPPIPSTFPLSTDAPVAVSPKSTSDKPNTPFPLEYTSSIPPNVGVFPAIRLTVPEICPSFSNFSIFFDTPFLLLYGEYPTPDTPLP